MDIKSQLNANGRLALSINPLSAPPLELRVTEYLRLDADYPPAGWSPKDWSEALDAVKGVLTPGAFYLVGDTITVPTNEAAALLTLAPDHFEATDPRSQAVIDQLRGE